MRCSKIHHFQGVLDPPRYQLVTPFLTPVLRAAEDIPQPLHPPTTIYYYILYTIYYMWWMCVPECVGIVSGCVQIVSRLCPDVVSIVS